MVGKPRPTAGEILGAGKKMSEVSVELKPGEGEVGASALLTLLQTHLLCVSL